MTVISGSGGSRVSRILPGGRAAFNAEITPSRKKPLVSISGKHLGAAYVPNLQLGNCSRAALSSLRASSLELLLDTFKLGVVKIVKIERGPLLGAFGSLCLSLPALCS